ncbi:hypothetical protein BE15_13495 [Sorangium cellulosum]|uniref:Uncharacterized protein n=1 Tax=Sorangium cellulosum TaxID=56 RepID=A0A150QKM1_SORCE|nr:hypothetical protein BE15_13495 [Sorangium cellulosum]
MVMFANDTLTAAPAFEFTTTACWVLFRMTAFASAPPPAPRKYTPPSFVCAVKSVSTGAPALTVMAILACCSTRFVVVMIDVGVSSTSPYHCPATPID